MAPKRSDRSVSLQRLLELTPLSSGEAVYVALSLLAALADRQGASGAPPRPAQVRVTDQGDLLLAEQAIPSPALVGDAVLAVGQMLVPALAAPDPLLEVALDSLAMGALGRTPDVASGALRHQLPGLAAPETLSEARADLAEFVRNLYAPGLDGRVEQVAAAEAAEPGFQPPTMLIGAGVAVLIVLAVIFSFTGGGPAPHARTAATIPPPASPSAVEPTAQATAAAPTPVAYVPPAPAAAGRLRGVALSPDRPCQVGGRCAASVELRFAGAGASTPLTWGIVFYDGCDGSSRPLGHGAFTAPQGWNRVVSDATVSLPADLHAGRLVVVTNSPDVVASDPVEVAGPACV